MTLGFGPIGSAPLGGVPAADYSPDQSRLLVAIYFEQDFVGQKYVPVRSLSETYDFTSQNVETWLLDLVGGGLLASDLRNVDSPSVELTPTGRSMAQEAVANGVQARRLTTFSDGSAFSDGTKFSDLVPAAGDKTFRQAKEELSERPIEADSSSWTGLSKTRVDARNARQIGHMIDRALQELAGSNASNEQIMQAAAYLKAAKELVEAPEPPSELIWQLLSKAADIVGLASLFFMLFAPASH